LFFFIFFVFDDDTMINETVIVLSS